MINEFYIDEVIKRALAEDVSYLDITSDTLIKEDQISDAYFLSKERGILCGIEISLRVFSLLDKDAKFEILKRDGEEISKGDIIANIRGKTRQLLTGERTALNLLQRMTGIATATHRAVKAVEGTAAQITDTRKTVPGLRALDKYAVAVGGGKNHRFNLSDAALIKNNHVDAVGSITEAINKLRSKVGHTMKIEAEARDLEEFKEALEAGADIIMLDNMTLNMMTSAVKLGGGRVFIEASGGITEIGLKTIAETGVDIISMGSLTHSVKAHDIAMRIK
jgi:nicotinate-nucleotide pyrophosphorylase (carboxylating)